VGYGDATWVDRGDASLEGNVLWVLGLVAENVGLWDDFISSVSEWGRKRKRGMGRTRFL